MVFVAALGGLRLFKSSLWTAHIVSLKKYINLFNICLRNTLKNKCWHYFTAVNEV